MMYSAHMESVSIEQDMKDRTEFGATLVITQIVIGVAYMVFGVVVYFFFGEATGRMCVDTGNTGSAANSTGFCSDWQVK